MQSSRLGASRSSAPRKMSCLPNAMLHWFEMPVVTQQHDAVARGDAEHSDEAHQRAQGQMPPVRNAPATPPIKREGQRQRHQQHQPVRPKIHMQKHEDSEEGKRGEQQQAVPRGLQCGVFAEEFRMISLIEGERLDALARSRARHCPDRFLTTLHVTSMRREAFSRLISFGVGRHVQIGDVARAARAHRRVFRWSVRAGIADRSGRVPRPTRATSKHFLILVDLAHLGAFDERRGGAPTCGRA
jgi:hypothetical protein